MSMYTFVKTKPKTVPRIDRFRLSIGAEMHINAHNRRCSISFFCVFNVAVFRSGNTANRGKRVVSGMSSIHRHFGRTPVQVCTHLTRNTCRVCMRQKGGAAAGNMKLKRIFP